MSLQVWLPLRGNLDNYGLTNVTVTNNGATVNNAGKIGQCYSFNGTNQYIDCGDYTSGKQNRNISICFWIYPQDVSGNKLCAGSRHGSNQRLYFGILGGHISYGAGSNGWSSWTGCEVETNKWYHIALVFDNNRVGNFYINGVLKHTRSTGSFSFTGDFDLGRGNNGESYRQAMFNDLRIYDHALSPREVKEIAKGLVLHYPFDDEYCEVTTNYIPYPNVTGPITNLAWDAENHANAVYVSGWSSGYNSGVSDPTHGYHAHWEVIDDIPTIVIPDINSSISQTHRWICMSGGMGNITPTMFAGKTYSISFDAKSDVENKHIFTAVYYRKTSDGSYNFYDGYEQIYLTTEWKRYSFTRTSDTNVYAISGLYIYGHGSGVEGTSFIKNIQFEFKDHSTPYANGTRTQIDITDCSGYLNNGTCIGDLQYFNGSPRYSKHAQFDSCGIQTQYSSYGLDVLTYSAWIKLTSYGSNDVSCISIGGTYFVIKNDGKLGAYAYGKSPAGYHYGTTIIPLNTWTHVAVVWTTTQVIGYVNSVQDFAVNCTGAFSHNIGHVLGSEYANGTNRKFSGCISDFRIYATALSADDIKELYDTSAYIHNTGNISVYEINESANNLLQYENTLLYTNEANTSSTRGKYVERNGVLAMAFKPTDTYYGSGDTRNNKLLYGLFKENTQYLFDLWMDVDDCVYASDGLNKYGGFYIYYTDGTNYNGYVIKGADANEDKYGWQHKVYISAAGKTIRSIGIYYWGNWVFHVRADSCIVELSETGIEKNGIINSGQFIEDTDVAFIGKATFNSNNIIEI